MCGELTAIGHNPDVGSIALPIRCRQWNCPTCGPRERRKLIRRFVAGAPEKLLTLTHKPDPLESTEQAFHRLSLAVNKLFKRIRRFYPHATVAYALVWERTKAGHPHCHILLRAPYLPQTWLSATWQQLTGASIVDIRSVHQGGQIASYVAKYLTKELSVPRNMKRFRTSRNWPPGPPRGVLSDAYGITTWALVAAPVSSIATLWNAQGAECTLVDNFLLVGRIGPPPLPGPDLDSPEQLGPFPNIRAL